MDKKPFFFIRMFVPNTSEVEETIPVANVAGAAENPSSEVPVIVMTNTGYYLKNKDYYMNKIANLAEAAEKEEQRAT